MINYSDKMKRQMYDTIYVMYKICHIVYLRTCSYQAQTIYMYIDVDNYYVFLMYNLNMYTDICHTDMNPNMPNQTYYVFSAKPKTVVLPAPRKPP